MTSAEMQNPVSTAVDYDPFADAPLARVVPSTEPQREIWLAAKLEPEASLAYNESVSLRLRGKLDAAAMQAALQALVDRHEALRATLSPNGADFCIAEHVDLAYAVRDLVALDSAARDAEIAATLRRVVETTFDLEKGPLLRAELLRFGDEDHLLVITAHHIVCDGWSWGVLVNDLAALYRDGAGAALPQADSFGDFALAQAALPDSEEHRADEAYWLARFTGSTPSLDLPIDRPRPRRRTFTSLREDHVLDAALITQLKSLGAKRRASLYATLLSGFGVLLQRLSGQDDVVIGIPAAGQAAGGHQALVGHCVNVLPLRASIDAAAPFTDILDRVRGDLLDAFDHQQYTLGTLLKRLALARDASRLPLVSVLFNLDQALDESTVALPGLSFDFFGNPRTFENFELFINAVQVDGAVRLECQYNSDLFDAATMRRWLEAYESLLRAAIAAPETATGALPLVSAGALEALRALQPAPTPFDEHALVSDLVFAQAARAPERSALICGTTRWSYADLASRAHAIAHALHARGIGDGALVGICLQRGADMVAALLGVLETGAAYVPLDPAFPRERLAFMAGDAKLALLLTETALDGTIDWPRERTLRIDEAGVIDAQQAAPLSRNRADAESAAYVIYTSGSTGKPKGVRVPHRAVVNFLTSMQREPGLAAGDRLLAVTTLSFDIAVLELLLPLTVGAEVILATREQAMDGHQLADLAATSAATVMQATPATWRLLLEAGWRGNAGFKILCGGESLPIDLAARLLEQCGSLWNMYGPTETTVWSTCCRVEHPERGITIGHPIANTSVWILDDACKPCPVGIAGEIAIGGAGVTLGYLDRADLTRDRFVADPFSNTPGARLYRTGDRGRWRNEGTLEHLGRLDFQVKLRGYRIELGEIETTIAAHADVTRAVAITREDRPGDVRLVAYVVARAGAAIDENALRKHLRAGLPDYMIPQHFVILPAIPLLPNGKIDRKALPAPGAQTATATAATHVAPRNDIERGVATAMEETLALPGIGVDDDFFVLGGHSLLAAQLTARLNREFSTALSLRTVFDTPTVAGLAEAIASANAGGPAAVERIAARSDQKRAPLSLLQKRLWLFEQLNPGSVVYNTPSAHRLRGTLDEAAFGRAFDELVRRQSSLRTAIAYAGEDIVQEIHDAVPTALFPAEDFSHLPAAERDATLAQRLDALTNQPFDLTQAPLFRARMFRLAADEHVLFFMPHHIVWDGWSFDLFYEEFAALYVAFKAGAANPLAPLPVSYGDFADWHTQWLKGEEYAAQFQCQLAWWRERLATHGAPPPLPTDKPRRPGMAGTGDTEWISVSRERTEALREVARGADATLFMALLAAYYVLLYRVVGDGNLVVGTPVRVRRSTEVEKVMGLFTNLLPLPLDVDPSTRFVDLVRQVKTVVLDGFSNPEIQLEDLMREPGMREAAGATHFYQAQFSYQDARQRNNDWGGLAHENMPLFQRGASEDLAVWFLEHGDGMIGGVLYNADILETETARRLARDYLSLLDGAIRHPERSIADMSRADAGDIERMRRWNAATAELPAPTAHALVEAAIDRAPQRNALTFGSWGTTYAEIEQRANRIAACLRKRGAGADNRVGLCSEHGPNRVAAMLGILKCGAACVLLDPADATAQVKDLLQKNDCSVLVCDVRTAAALDWPRERALCFDADTSELIAASNERVAVAIDAQAVAFILQDHEAHGGSRPVAITHHGLVNTISGLGRALALDAQASVIGIASPAAPASVLETLIAFANGAELVQASRAESESADALSRWLSGHAKGFLFAPAEIWTSIAAKPDRDDGALHAVCLGTPDSALAATLLSRCATLWSTFGVAATAMVSTCARIADATSVHAGVPLANTGVWVLDAQGQPCAPGVAGMVHVGGAGIGPGITQDDATRITSAFAGPLLDTGRRGRWNADETLDIFADASRERPVSLSQSAAADEMANAAGAAAVMTPQEQWLIGIWQESLGTQEVTPADNFFDLGGHSLLAMTMVAKVEKLSRIRLNLLKVANSTLRALAAELPENVGTELPAAAPASLSQRVRGLFGFGKRGASE